MKRRIEEIAAELGMNANTLRQSIIWAARFNCTDVPQPTVQKVVKYYDPEEVYAFVEKYRLKNDRRNKVVD